MPTSPRTPSAGIGLAAAIAAAIGLAPVLAPVPVSAQSPATASALAARTSVVVLGTVEKVRASEEPLQAPGDATVVIKVERMYAGAEIAGDLAGQRATVVLSRPAANLKPGDRAIFYGEPRFIGRTMTIADLGETSADVDTAGLAKGLQAHQDAPLRARLAIADAVFAGVVEKVGPLGPAADDKRRRDGEEHAPELQLAMVRVKTGLRGVKAGALVPVAFASSCDILWCGAPKLKVGEQAVIIAHRPQRDEAAVLRASPRDRALLDKAQALLVTAPFDVRPASELDRVQRVLQTKEMQ